MLFLLRFFVSYILLVVVYQLYLNQFDVSRFEVDGFTRLVAEQSKQLLLLFGYTVGLVNSDVEPSVIVLVGQVPFVRIVEGCNAISIMILFAAFVVAFNRGFLRTTLFILAGVIFIHILNIFRIPLLIIGLLRFPEYRVVLHDIVFPVIIYGGVFSLWIIWINRFSLYGKK